MEQNDRIKRAQERIEEAINRCDKLSKREREVLETICLFGSGKETADALYISELTLKSHLRNIQGKLYLDRTTQAVYAYTLWKNRQDSQPDQQSY